ncbi:MAG: hypothetical protein M1833_003326 [Piccolia ochrophora]|nr:MAG: hypothetical protein M1833_003326 [Piccolia ochrophora]
MTELSFAKQFLTTLDSRPIHLQNDHVEDPKKYPSQPAYILPKMPHPMNKRQKLVPGQERSINVSLKSSRNPPLDVTLSSQPVSTSVHELKLTVADKVGVTVEKVRLLLKKKPCAESKTIKELVTEGDREVEFSVMVMGGAPAPAPSTDAEKDSTDTSVAQGPSGHEVLQSEAFWDDLKGFLMQRLRDEKEGARVFAAFRSAWREKIAS